ncbi:MAG: PepSY domain-containing protein [Bacillota bacterium]|nr:PepSY domain-containing protein [Bacillota bacterium]
MMTTMISMTMMTTISMTMTRMRSSFPRCRQLFWRCLAAAGLSLLFLLGSCSRLSTGHPDSTTTPVRENGPESELRLGFDDTGEVLYITGRHAEAAIAIVELRALVGLPLPEAVEQLLVHLEPGGYAIDDLEVDGNTLILELGRADDDDDDDDDDDWQEFQQGMDRLYSRLGLPAFTHSRPRSLKEHSEPEIDREAARGIAEFWIEAGDMELIYLDEELEYHNGILFYDLEVLAGDRLFELHIDARNGDMLEFSERPCAASSIRLDNDGACAIDNSADGAPQSFSLAEARALAGTWIGHEEAELHFAREELKYRQGVLFYELEIITGEQKYIFQIDAFDGEVLQFLESSAPR